MSGKKQKTGTELASLSKKKLKSADVREPAINQSAFLALLLIGRARCDVCRRSWPR